MFLKEVSSHQGCIYYIFLLNKFSLAEHKRLLKNIKSTIIYCIYYYSIM